MDIKHTVARRTILQAGLAGGSTALAHNVAHGKSVTAAKAPIGETRHGKVRGILLNGIKIFKGIPYAAPPVGDLRFMPPVKPKDWPGVADATHTARRCMQGDANYFNPVGHPTGDYYAGGQRLRLGLQEMVNSEDCLLLNVLTPGLRDGKKRPVLVYIHGGGFHESSAVITMAGDGLPRDSDVVLVSINHRLNVFGYLYLGDISDKYADSGNIGMLDLVAALQWVRDNIANFGGDPGSVTIFGESGGGGKITTLMAMPAAKGLFHRAIIESGATLRVSTKDDSVKRTRTFLEKLGLTDKQVDELKKIPADKLWLASKELKGGYRPVIDGRSIFEQVWDPVAPAVSADIPLIIGTCKDEGTSNGDRESFHLDDAGLRARVAKMMPEAEVDKVIAMYKAAKPKATPSDIFFELSADRGPRATAITQAERKAALGKAPVFMYLFKYEPAVGDGSARASHTFELPLVLRMVLLPESEKLSRQLSSAWAAFARSGNPSHPGLPDWPAYETGKRATMMFDRDESVAVNDPHKEKRIRLASIPRPARP